jgi:hypothetical protein
MREAAPPAGAGKAGGAPKLRSWLTRWWSRAPDGGVYQRRRADVLMAAAGLGVHPRSLELWSKLLEGTLSDDAFSARFAWLTNGKAGPDGLRPHDDRVLTMPSINALGDSRSATITARGRQTGSSGEGGAPAITFEVRPRPPEPSPGPVATALSSFSNNLRAVRGSSNSGSWQATR